MSKIFPHERVVFDHAKLRSDIYLFRMIKEGDHGSYSLRDMEKDSGVSHNTFARYIKKKDVQIDIDTLCKICTMLNESPGKYFRGWPKSMEFPK